MDMTPKAGTSRDRIPEERIPQDPVMLLSFVNLKLRDFYGSLEMLCEDLNADSRDITDRLSAIGYHYDAEKNRFV
ncbi:MAG: DUF4250 domain-containing protein [Bacteroides sp.]|nr:DUF4250 domain-containing protein [Bacteroides sp.]